MYPARFFGKRFNEIGAPARAHPDLLHPADGATARDLLLASVSQAAALTAGENIVAKIAPADLLLAVSQGDGGGGALGGYGD